METFSARTSAHRRELEESREEILVGEIIRWMADAGYPVIGIASDFDFQRIRFRTRKDPIVHTVLVAVDRIHSTRGHASLMIRGETHIYASQPDDILALGLELERRLAKAPASRDWEIGRDTSIVYAATKTAVNLTQLLQNTGRSELEKTLEQTLTALRKTLSPFQLTRGDSSS